MTSKTATVAEFAEAVTVRLDTWNATWSAQDKRFFHVPDGKKWYSVEITRDLRVSCRCPRHAERVATGEGEICWHVADALEYMDAVGWKRMASWPLTKTTKKVA